MGAIHAPECTLGGLGRAGFEQEMVAGWSGGLWPRLPGGLCWPCPEVNRNSDHRGAKLSYGDWVRERDRLAWIQ